MAKNHRGKGNYLERRHQERQKNTVIYGDADRAFSAPSPFEMKHRQRKSAAVPSRYDGHITKEMAAFSHARFAEQRRRDAERQTDTAIVLDSIVFGSRRFTDLDDLNAGSVTTGSLARYYGMDPSDRYWSYDQHRGGDTDFSAMQGKDAIDVLAAYDGPLICVAFPDNLLPYLKKSHEAAYEKLMRLSSNAGVDLMQRYDYKGEATPHMVLNMSTVGVINGLNLTSYMAFLAQRAIKSPFVVTKQIAAMNANPQPRKVKLEDD